MTNGSEVTLEDTTVTDNWAYYGGGAYVTRAGSADPTTLILQSSEVSANTGYYYGAGLYLDDYTTVTSSETVYEGNYGYSATGVGAYLDSYATLTSTDDTWTDNGLAYYWSGYWGGAVYAGAYSTLAVQGSSFSGNYNYYGGAIAAYYADVTLTEAVFDANVAYGYGGAFYGNSYVDLTVSDSVFTSNAADAGQGGALYHYYYGSSAISGTTFDANSATGSGGALLFQQVADAVVAGSTITGNASSAGYSGGIYAYYGVDLTLADSAVTGNSAYRDGGGIYQESYGNTVITGTTVSGNETSAGNGGGIFVNAVSAGIYDLTLEDSVIADNEAYYHGGGLYAIYLASLSLQGNRITGNSADTSYNGGGAYLYYNDSHEVRNNLFCVNDAYDGGGAYQSYTYGGTDDWTNNLFVESQARHSASALYLGSSYYTDFVNNSVVGNDANFYGAIYSYYSYATYTNNAFAYTQDGTAVYAAETYSSTYSDFLDWYLNTPADTSGYFAVTMGTDGNIADKPMFTAHSMNGDCDDDDFTLQAGSALIDAGYPIIYDPDGTVSDIGAYGGPHSTVYDMDGDGS